MQACLICLALLMGQMDLQSKPVAHLPPHRNYIGNQFGGKLLELIDAPAVVSLPEAPPRLDSHRVPWEIDIKNLGPQAVSVVSRSGFRLTIHVGQTVHISWNGAFYSRK